MRCLARLLREIRPDIVLTRFPKEREGLVNPHAITGQIVLFAISLAGSADPGDRNPPHRFAQLFFFGTGAAKIPQNAWDARGGYYNDVFIDITDVGRQKTGRAGLPGQLGIRRHLCPQANRNQRRGLWHRRPLRLRERIYLLKRRDPLLPAPYRPRTQGLPFFGSRDYEPLYLPQSGRLNPYAHTRRVRLSVQM